MNKGKLGEKIALDYLLANGLVLVEQNWREKNGELDLIMNDNKVLVFIEVKYRSSNKFGTPIEAVNKHKQNKIRTLARQYLYKSGEKKACRFDVIGIIGNKINWIKGAFE